MNESNFESITQFDKSFDNLFENKNLKGYACGIFSLLTANSYLNNILITKDVHENNIRKAVKICSENKIFYGMSFDELLSTTNLYPENINSTSVELIINDVIGYNHMFNIKDKCAVIFLKNEKFFVVICDKNKYYLRDCHESKQYNFDSLEELIQRLNTAYQFDNQIDLIVDEYTNYSSIEFIKITENFNFMFN
jgi:hypothetical protein